jgi:hypothetical protein
VPLRNAAAAARVPRSSTVFDIAEDRQEDHEEKYLPSADQAKNAFEKAF